LNKFTKWLRPLTSKFPKLAQRVFSLLSIFIDYLPLFLNVLMRPKKAQWANKEIQGMHSHSKIFGTINTKLEENIRL